MQMPEISVKEIVAFVKAHKKMLNICPIELLDEKEFSDFELEKLEQDYQIKKRQNMDIQNFFLKNCMIIGLRRNLTKKRTERKT